MEKGAALVFFRWKPFGSSDLGESTAPNCVTKVVPLSALTPINPETSISENERSVVSLEGFRLGCHVLLIDEGKKVNVHFVSQIISFRFPNLGPKI